jgi:hypothetical protein
VYSTALLAPALATRLVARSERLLLMSVDRAGLRQSYIESGRLRHSRRERVREDGAGFTSARVRVETERMLKYLGTLRTPPSGTPAMRVVLLVPDAERAHFDKTLGSGGGISFTTIGMTEAARRIGLRHPPEGAEAEMLFLHIAAHQPPKEQFLRGESRRSFLVWKLQHSFVASGVAGFVACGLYAATLWLEQLAVRERIDAARRELTLTHDRLARLDARLPATPAPVETLKASALELHRIAARSGSPEAAFDHVSRALDQSPRIELDALAWTAEQEQVLEIHAHVKGAARSDHRTVADEVQRFAGLLGADSGWRVVATRLPFDLSSEGVLASAAGTDAAEEPRFSVRIARGPG